MDGINTLPNRGGRCNKNRRNIIAFLIFKQWPASVGGIERVNPSMVHYDIIIVGRQQLFSHQLQPRRQSGRPQLIVSRRGPRAAPRRRLRPRLYLRSGELRCGKINNFAHIFSLIARLTPPPPNRIIQYRIILYAPRSPPMAQAGPKKMNWWYRSIIEWMLQNPDGKLRECAQAVGCSQTWLSCIINSDAFRLAYESARGEHFENTSYSVISKMEGIALLTAEILEDRLETEGDTMPIGQVQSTAELALKSLGYISQRGNSGPPVHIHNQVGVGISVDRGVLEASRERMRYLTHPPQISNEEKEEELPIDLHSKVPAS